MKRVVSISLGSSSRNKTVESSFFGETFCVERIGVDGSFEKYAAKLDELDGKVDAIGIGGMDVYIWANGRKYAFRDARRMVSRLKQTPWVDGSGLKNTLERETVLRLQRSGVLDFRGSRVLMVAGVDRFGMAEALHEMQADLCLGDLMFAVGIPVPIRKWWVFERAAALILPWIVKVPFKWLYPTGQKQESSTPKWENWYDWADVIAGDFLLIRRFMPGDLQGKTILTNTTTAEDREELMKRGVARLITTTPVIEGRSFGTNVMEAVLVTVAGKRPEEIRPEDYMDMLNRLRWEPNVDHLTPAF